MKRTVAFLAVVCVSIGIVSATDAFAQVEPPASASGDTLQGGDSPTAPTTPAAQPAARPTQAPAAEADTTAALSARERRARMRQGGIAFVLSLGLGSAIPREPDELVDDFNPSFGGILSMGARRYGITVSGTFDYNFFLREGTTPNDLNILMGFVDIKYTPMHSKARPYLLACGGWYRQWIVDTGYTENVLGYGGGVGVEVELDPVRRLFIEGRYVQGQTREADENKSNTEIIPFRLGVTWEIR
jgi:hypothetical protein